MSRGASTVLARLAALGVQIIEAPIEKGYLGWYDQETRTVTVSAGMPWRKKRSTLAHELAHVELGHAMRPGWWGSLYEPAMEAEADELAARELIPLHQLADVLRTARDAEEAAARLDVDRHTVRVRVETLTAAERRYVEEVTHPHPRRP